MRPPRALSEDDRILWTQVARTATPLKGRKPVAEPEPEPVPAPAEQMKTAPPPAVGAPDAPSPAPAPRQRVSHLDRPTHDKLAQGRLSIDARVDLHGLTQAEAYGLLLSFLHRAHARGLRYVLVITGKGSSSKGDGVLRRMVPQWLATPAFRSVVSSHDGAARHHGGGGALYIRLRKITSGP